MGARLFCVAVASSLVGWSAVASADPSPDDVVTATALYDEGVKLLGEKRYGEACPKLVESQRLDPGGGTLVGIALCHEGEGKLATAWSDWNLALTKARADGKQARMDAANEHIAALAPRLSRLRIVIPASAPADLEVRRGTALVGRAQWGVALPIDAGSHVVEAFRGGRSVWRSTVEISVEGATTDVTASFVSETPRAPEAPSERAGLGGRRVVALVLGGAGVVAVGVGSVFGLVAHSKWSDAQSNDCHGTVCNAAGVALAGDARTDGNLGTGFFVGGLALVAGAAVTWFTAPSPASASLRFVPMALRSGGGFALGGSFQ